MRGHGGLGKSQLRGQVPHPDFTVGHPLHNPQPGRIAQGMEQGRSGSQFPPPFVHNRLIMNRHTPMITHIFDVIGAFP